MNVRAADLDALCLRMRSERRVALAVHEKPDLDALGAAAGMLDLFGQLGIDAGLYVAEGELLPLADVLLLVFLDELLDGSRVEALGGVGEGLESFRPGEDGLAEDYGA